MSLQQKYLSLRKVTLTLIKDDDGDRKRGVILVIRVACH